MLLNGLNDRGVTMPQHLTGRAHLEIDVSLSLHIPFFSPEGTVNEDRVRVTVAQFVADTARQSSPRGCAEAVAIHATLPISARDRRMSNVARSARSTASGM